SSFRATECYHAPPCYAKPKRKSPMKLCRRGDKAPSRLSSPGQGSTGYNRRAQNIPSGVETSAMIATLRPTRALKLLLVLLLPLLRTVPGKAQQVRDSLAKVNFFLFQKNWDNADQVLSSLEKAG